MSASEKLRALEPRTIAPWETKRWPHRGTEVIGPSDPDRPGYRLLVAPKESAGFAVALRNALPQIVALTEAAERIPDVGKLWSQDVMTALKELKKALS